MSTRHPAYRSRPTPFGSPPSLVCPAVASLPLSCRFASLSTVQMRIFDELRVVDPTARAALLRSEPPAARAFVRGQAINIEKLDRREPAA